MANREDPDEMPHSAVSHLGLHWPVYPNIMVNTVLKYSIFTAASLEDSTFTQKDKKTKQAVTAAVWSLYYVGK